MAPNLLAQPGERRQLQVAVQTPQYRIDSLDDLARTPIAGAGRRPDRSCSSNLATFSRGSLDRRWSATTTCSRSFDIYASVQERDLGARGDGYRPDRRRGHAAAAARAHSSTCAARWRPCTRRSRGLRLGPGVRRRAGLPADGGQLPVLARPVHHHHGAARRAGRHRLDAVRHQTTLSVPALTGAIMMHRRGDGQQHPGRHLRHDERMTGKDALAAALSAGYTRSGRC